MISIVKNIHFALNEIKVPREKYKELAKLDSRKAYGMYFHRYDDFPYRYKRKVRNFIEKLDTLGVMYTLSLRVLFPKLKGVHSLFPNVEMMKLLKEDIDTNAIRVENLVQYVIHSIDNDSIYYVAIDDEKNDVFYFYGNILKVTDSGYIENLAYVYEGKLNVMSEEIVDDIITASSCFRKEIANFSFTSRIGDNHPFEMVLQTLNQKTKQYE